MRNAVRQVAIVWPASSALLSNATPIFAASSAKRTSSWRGMDAWPAAATILAISAGSIGRRMERFSTSRPIWANCCGVLKSTTLRTSAIADSNSIASLIGSAEARKARWPANAIPAP